MILQNIVRANSRGIRMVAKILLAFYIHAVLVRVNSNETLVPFDRGAL